PQEGSRESNQEGSASAADEFGTPIAGTVGAQPECTSIVGDASTRFARGQRGQLVHRRGQARWACPRRFGRRMGGALQRGRSGSGGAAGRRASTYPVWRGGARLHSGGVSAAAGSRAGRDGDLVIEHLAAHPTTRSGRSAEGQYVHDLGSAARRRRHVAARSDLV